MATTRVVPPPGATAERRNIVSGDASCRPFQRPAFSAAVAGLEGRPAERVGYRGATPRRETGARPARKTSTVGPWSGGRLPLCGVGTGFGVGCGWDDSEDRKSVV